MAKRRSGKKMDFEKLKEMAEEFRGVMEDAFLKVDFSVARPVGFMVKTFKKIKFSDLSHDGRADWEQSPPKDGCIKYRSTEWWTSVTVVLPDGQEQHHVYMGHGEVVYVCGNTVHLREGVFPIPNDD